MTMESRSGAWAARDGLQPVAKPEVHCMQTVQEKILAQAILRLACRRYIAAVCNSRVHEARNLFRLYRALGHWVD